MGSTDLTLQIGGSQQLACFYSLTELIGDQEQLEMDIEFENEWETTSDWDEDDDEAVGEEAQLAFPNDGGRPQTRLWN